MRLMAWLGSGRQDGGSGKRGAPTPRLLCCRLAAAAGRADGRLPNAMISRLCVWHGCQGASPKPLQACASTARG